MKTIYIKQRTIGPLKLNLDLPSRKTRQRFEGWSREQLIKYIDGTCKCDYCELAREVLRTRERQLRFY